MSKFKESMGFDERCLLATAIRQKYPDKIPVILEKLQNSKMHDMEKIKYLVPGGMNIGQFIMMIKEKVKMSEEKALFIFINNKLPPTSVRMEDLYKVHADKDHFMYITYGEENTFG